MLFENIYKEKFGDGAFLDIDLVQQSGLGVKCTSNSKGEARMLKLSLNQFITPYTNQSRYFRKIQKKLPFLSDNTNIPHPRSSILINQWTIYSWQWDNRGTGLSAWTISTKEILIMVAIDQSQAEKQSTRKIISRCWEFAGVLSPLKVFLEPTRAWLPRILIPHCLVSKAWRVCCRVLKCLWQFVAEMWCCG